MNVDYDDQELIWAVIPDGWWLKSKTCKFMIACLVHKDNKDISSKPTKHPPGRTCENAHQEKDEEITKERAKAKAERPVLPSRFKREGDVDRAIKKARIVGQLHAEKLAVDNIISQVNVLGENAELYKEMHSEDRFKLMIVNLLNQLPGVPKNAGTVSSGQLSTPASRRGMEVDLTGDGNKDDLEVYLSGCPLLGDEGDAND